MPTVDVEENIKQIRSNIEKMTQEVFRLQGMLQTFEGFKQGGLKTIDLPENPYTEPVEKPVEKPVENTYASASGSDIMASMMANPSMMSSVAAAMANVNSSGKVPNQAPSDEELESVQEKPE